jgi:hypothetical protein
METLQISKATRNSKKIMEKIKVSKELTTALDDLYIIFPERYINRKLAFIDSEISLLSIYAIMDNKNNYAVVNAPIFQTLTPANVDTMEINGETYKVLEFFKGGVMIPNNTCVIRAEFLYDIFDEFFIKGYIPWFLSYEDISNVFEKAQEYAGSNIGSNPLIFEILTSVISRSPKNKKIYMRHVLNENNKHKIIPEYVGLSNPYYSFDNTGAKLIGSRFTAGLNVAIVEPETKTSATSEILRS